MSTNNNNNRKCAEVHECVDALRLPDNTHSPNVRKTLTRLGIGTAPCPPPITWWHSNLYSQWPSVKTPADATDNVHVRKSRGPKTFPRCACGPLTRSHAEFVNCCCCFVVCFARLGRLDGRRGCLHGMLLATAAKRTFLDFMLFEKPDFVIFGLPAVDVWKKLKKSHSRCRVVVKLHFDIPTLHGKHKNKRFPCSMGMSKMVFATPLGRERQK